MAIPAPDELAALRARAYGRGGQALSAEERARRAALEAGRPRPTRRRRAAAQPFLPLGIDTERIEASRGVVLAQSTWDELHLLGGAGDLLVWWGTSGAQTCIAIEARDLSFARACGDTAEVRGDGLAAAVGYQSDGELTQVTVRANPYAGVLVITRDNAAVG